MSAARQLCTFRVDDCLFGVPVEDVQEVLRHQAMTRVPRAHAVITGLMNLRGQIVTALSLRKRLGLRPAGADYEPMNVIVRSGNGVVSFLVDDIGDVISFEDSAVERPPPTLTEPARDLVRGVLKVNGQTLLVLDAQRTLDLDRQS